MRITLQFHATRADIFSMIGRWSEKEGLSVVYEAFFPIYRIGAAVVGGPVSGGSVTLDEVSRVSLQRGAVDLDVTSEFEYIDRNPNGLAVTIGRFQNGCLYESFLGAMTGDMESMKVWRRLKNQAKRSMEKGAWIVNDSTGARARDDSHSYTTTARDLQGSGVKMVGHSEVVRYELD